MGRSSHITNTGATPDTAGPRRRGRPTRLTPEVHSRIVVFLSQGALLKDAARACGVGEATVHEWIARGEGRDPDRPPTRELEEFARDVRESSAVAIVDASTRLVKQKPHTWLARRDPARWGPKGHAHNFADE